jgi:glycosyltransferase involved in cell wall biosynthesis
MSAPLVSVVITVYNREKYLTAAIESVLAQTFEDFEVVIVDDCSQDGSLEIARSYQKDLRVRVESNARNLGQFPNRTRGAELASGRYLKYVDSDDIIYPHSLAIMVAAIEAHPDAALALCHSSPDDDHPYPWKLSPFEAWRKQFLGRGCLSCGPSAAIMRREAFFAVGGFGQWGTISDVGLWYALAARWPVVLLPPGLVWWRQHDQQTVTKDNVRVYWEEGFPLTMAMLLSPECPLPEGERQLALARAKQHHARHILSLAIRSRRLRTAWRLFKGSGIGFRGLLRGLQRYQ